MLNLIRKCCIYTFLFSLTVLVSVPAFASGSTLLGVFNGNPSSKVMTEYTSMQAWQNKPNAVGAAYLTWCKRDISYAWSTVAMDLWSDSNVPELVWQPEDINCTTDDSDPDTEIANGQQDTYITNFLTAAKTFLAGPDGVYGTSDDRRVYIRFAHEANGNWYPWSPAYPGSTDTPTDYINMWIHVVTMARNMGLDSDHLEFIWNVNASDVGAYTAEELFPGNTYLNWVSIDGYNWGASQSWSTWQTAEQVFGNMIGRVQPLSTLPLAIPEVGSVSYTSSGESVSAKAAWINDYFTNFIPTYNIKMTCWFNIDQSGEQDWAIFGGKYGDATYGSYNVYAEYATGASASTILGSTPSNPRLLTSAQFAGQI